MRRAIWITIGILPFALVTWFWCNASWYFAPRPVIFFAVVGAVLLGFGSLVCVLNIWLSFGRALSYRLRCGSMDGYHHISGVPLFGTWFVMFGVWSLVPGTAALSAHQWPFPVALLLMAADTGGLHWFLYSTWHCDDLWNPPKNGSSD
jgi:hypothetical protein